MSLAIGIIRLPPELILRICQLLSSRADIAIIALVSRTYRQIAIPFLHREIILTNSQSAYHCCSTLASPNNDFAEYVRSFTIEAFVPWKFGPHHHAFFRNALVCSIHKMKHLQHFRCLLPGSFGRDICAALSMRSTLKSLAVSLPPVDQWTSHSPSDLWPHDPLRPVFPSLQAFEFNYLYERGPLGLLFERFTEHMLKRHAYQLKHLVFPAWITSDYFGVLVSSAIHFPNLESITIRSSALTMTIASQMPNLKSLTFPTFEPVTPSIPPHSFPSLRRFSGSCRCFSDILTRERPITHVQFDGAVFDMEDASIFAEGAQPTWSDVFDAIKQFPMSSGPVHHLSFYVSSINLSALRKTLPYVRSLKSIVICLRSNPKDVRIHVPSREIMALG